MELMEWILILDSTIGEHYEDSTGFWWLERCLKYEYDHCRMLVHRSRVLWLPKIWE